MAGHLRLEGRGGGAGQREHGLLLSAQAPGRRAGSHAKPRGAGAPQAVRVCTCCSWPAVVATAHHPVVFFGLFLFFLGFTTAYARYQHPLLLKEALLVAFFLAGLVVLGSMQQWWLQPLVSAMDPHTLFFGALGLTAITDNAALTYLGSLIEGLSAESRYTLVAGAVAGGGLTVIANAPNPAGVALLRDGFRDGSIGAVGLLLGPWSPRRLPPRPSCCCSASRPGSAPARGASWRAPVRARRRTRGPAVRPPVAAPPPRCGSARRSRSPGLSRRACVAIRRTPRASGGRDHQHARPRHVRLHQHLGLAASPNTAAAALAAQLLHHFAVLVGDHEGQCRSPPAPRPACAPPGRSRPAPPGATGTSVGGHRQLGQRVVARGQVARHCERASSQRCSGSMPRNTAG